MASVHCDCDRVCVTFANERPRRCAQCCCCDCRSITNWCASKGRSDPSSNITSNDDNTIESLPKNKPATLFYVDNDILQVRGEEELKLVKLRTDSPSLRIVAKCCHSLMFTMHPLYFRNRVMIVGDACGKFEYKNQQDIVPVSCRMQTKFWNEESQGPLPELPNEECVSVASDSPTWFFVSGMAQSMLLPSPTKDGFTANALLDRLGLWNNPIEYIGIEEPDLQGHFKTGGGMFTLTFKNPFYKSNEEDPTMNTERSEQ